uniref:Type IV secretion protein VirB3 n=2 Tax=Ochrobactrum sp. LM19 TaxID=1449781 RepID=A0A0D5A0R3_9HYPH|nr:type IV secretion protein VirB3 [Ochrobactrum sp. LM19]
MALFYAEIAVVMILFVQTENLFMLLLIVPLHALFYWLTIRDENFSSILRARAFRYRLWRDNSSYNP